MLLSPFVFPRPLLATATAPALFTLLGSTLTLMGLLLPFTPFQFFPFAPLVALLAFFSLLFSFPLFSPRPPSPLLAHLLILSALTQLFLLFAFGLNFLPLLFSPLSTSISVSFALYMSAQGAMFTTAAAFMARVLSRP